MGSNLNLITLVALLSWPLIAIWLYKTRPVATATIWTILGGYLLLPVGASFKIPMVPQFDKTTIPNLTAFFSCWMVVGRPVRFLSRFGITETLILIYIISPVITSELNGDQIQYGIVTLEGVGLYDGISAAISQFIVLLPFFLGRRLLMAQGKADEILRALIVAGVVYSLPALFEIRMSPQLHTWIYGYFPHSMFGQQIRDSGFRPVVFIGHGLLVSFFFLTTTIAAAAFWRAGISTIRTIRVPPALVAIYLSGVLVLCKTASALIYGTAVLPLVCFTKARLQMAFAVALITIALTYPVLRLNDVFPTTTMLHMAQSISSDRARSLEVRFENEDQLLQRAYKRFFFGWGRWGRSRVYDSYGKDVSLTDGRWIITMGQFGLVGFLAEFGLLVIPILRMASAIKFSSSNRDKIFLSALTLILAINIVDLIPNSPLSPLTWLIAGALLGQAELLRATMNERGFSANSIATPNTKIGMNGNLAPKAS